MISTKALKFDIIGLQKKGVTVMNKLAIWTLMHKNLSVADVELVERNATITEVIKTYHLSHAPLGTVEDHMISDRKLEDWLSKRAIPASRQNIDEVLAELKIQNTRKLSLKSYGLSLSDQYWIKPKDQNILWESINFFQNDFSTQMGEILSQEKKVSTQEIPDISFYTPDSSADGWLKKRWIIQNNKRLLLKGASVLYEQEPFNEKIASDIMTHLGIDHIPYTMMTYKKKPYSVCETFITKDTELIPALNIVMHEPQKEGDNRLTHLLRGCVNLGMNAKRVKVNIDQMIVVDYLIGNYDRHWRNFGFIRDANTLALKGFSPLFDNGASLWQHHPQVRSDVKTETFKEYETLDKQLQVVTDLTWYEQIPDDVLDDLIKPTLDLHPTMQDDRKSEIINRVIKHAHDIAALKRKLHP